jgi:hypothetical protein
MAFKEILADQRELYILSRLPTQPQVQIKIAADVLPRKTIDVAKNPIQL